MATSGALMFHIRQAEESGDFFVAGGAELGAGNIDLAYGLEMGDGFKLFHVGITHGSAGEIQIVKLCHPAEFADCTTGNRVIRKIKLSDFREIFQMFELTILEPRVPQVEMLQS